jgi:hypothetical protein
LSKLVCGFFSWSSDWLELGVSAMVDLCVSSYDYIHAACPFYTHTAFSWVAGWQTEGPRTRCSKCEETKVGATKITVQIW